MNLQSQILSMKQYINDAEEQLAQLQAGRKSSSAKIRSNLMKVKAASHTLRRDVITFQKALPTKKRAKVIPVEAAVEAVIEPSKPEIIAEVVKKTRKPRSKKAANTE